MLILYNVAQTLHVVAPMGLRAADQILFLARGHRLPILVVKAEIAWVDRREVVEACATERELLVEFIPELKFSLYVSTHWVRADINEDRYGQYGLTQNHLQQIDAAKNGNSIFGLVNIGLQLVNQVW